MRTYEWPLRSVPCLQRIVYAAAAYCHALAHGGMNKGASIFVLLRGLVTAELQRPTSSGTGGASSGDSAATSNSGVAISASNSSSGSRVGTGSGSAIASSSGAPILWIAHSSHGEGPGTLCLEMGGYASLLAAAERDVRVRCSDHLIGVLLEVAGAAGGKDGALALATDLKTSVLNPQPGKISAALKSALAKLGMATARRLSAAAAPPSTAFATLVLPWQAK